MSIASRVSRGAVGRGTALRRVAVCLAGLTGLTGVLAISGCGTPAAPQPPSLKLPQPVADLSALRAGGAVTLRWTMPRRTTDRLPIKGQVPVRVCLKEGASTCEPVGETVALPGTPAEFHATLPAALQAGQPRAASYFVELMSRVGAKGRSAGLSNAASVVAGVAPAAIGPLTAQVTAKGVALRWAGTAAGAVRLHRKLISAPAGARAGKPKGEKAGAKAGNLMQSAPEPVERDLLVESGSVGGALDSTARFGESYEYTAQPLERVAQGIQVLELPGEVTAPVRVDVADTFPPAVPEGLAAVAVPEEKTIDLSWQPDTEEDLAGYFVYRAGDDSGQGGAWTRISGEKPVAEPAYRDRTVEAGHRYRYAVSAVDQTGHESGRSAEAAEAVPQN